jgi:hypothetical protein
MKSNNLKVIVDYDGTLTYEERYVDDLSRRAIKDLAENILGEPEENIKAVYKKTKSKIFASPHKYSWIVGGVPACYAHEGALLTNTVAFQTLLMENKSFKKKVELFFKDGYEYDPVTHCTNYLFHKHTHNLNPHFREKARDVLLYFIKQKGINPYILTCSLGSKVAKNLRRLKIGANGFTNGFKYSLNIFDDTKQYEMDDSWDYCFTHPELGKVQQVSVNKHFSIDLRRPAYFKRLQEIGKDGSRIIITADMVSLPGILPLLMGMDFVLLKAVYTPKWAVDFVSSWPNGWVIDDIAKLPSLVDKVMKSWLVQL